MVDVLPGLLLYYVDEMGGFRPPGQLREARCIVWASTWEVIGFTMHLIGKSLDIRWTPWEIS